MPPNDRLQRASAPVLRDVVATTGLRLQVSPWHGPNHDMGYAVHEAGALSNRPVWETYQLASRSGDAIALHPLSDKTLEQPGHGDHDDLVITVASATQGLVQMLLWQRHRDPTWPPCPAHAGRHPLLVLSRQMSWDMTEGVPLVHEDTGATWSCPGGGYTAPIGQL